MALVLILIRVDLLSTRLLIAGEFPSTLDYGRLVPQMLHSWNDSFDLGFANYMFRDEASYPVFFHYSPIWLWHLFLGAAVVDWFFFSPLLVYLYVVWTLFFVGGYLFSRALWLTSRLGHVAVGTAIALLHALGPPILGALASANLYLAYALALILFALYLHSLSALSRVPDRGRSVARAALVPLLAFAAVASVLASLGINLYPFVGLGLVIFAVAHIGITGLARRPIMVHLALLLVFAVVFLVSNIYLFGPRALFPEGPVFGDVSYPYPKAYGIAEVLTLGAGGLAGSPRFSLFGGHVLVAWLIPFLALAGALLERGRRSVSFWVLLGTGLFLMKGSAPPLAGVNQWLHESIPHFDLFGPTYRFWPLILWAYAFGIGALIIYLSSLSTRGLGRFLTTIVSDSVLHVRARRRVSALGTPLPAWLPLWVSAVLVGALVGWVSAPYFTGDIAGSIYSLQLPDDYTRWVRRAENTDDFGGRTLYLPWTYDQTTNSDFEWSPDEGSVYPNIHVSPFDSLLIGDYPLANGNIYKRGPSSRVLSYLLYRGFTDRSLFESLVERLDIDRVVVDTYANADETPVFDEPYGEDWLTRNSLPNRIRWLEESGTFRSTASNGERLLTFENTSSPEHFDFGRPLYVFGDLNSYQILGELAPHLTTRPFVFLDQNPMVLTQLVSGAIRGSDIAVVNMSLTDIAASLVPEAAHLDPADYARFGAPEAPVWRTPEPFHTGLIDIDGLTFTKKVVSAHSPYDLEIPVELNANQQAGSTSNRYVLLMRLLYNRQDHPFWPGEVDIEVLIDGLPRTVVDASITEVGSQYFAGLRWVSVEFQAPPGRHRLTLRHPSQPGVTVVGDLAIVDEEEWAAAMVNARSLLALNSVHFFATQSYLATFGEVAVNLPVDELSDYSEFVLPSGARAILPVAALQSKEYSETEPATVFYEKLTPARYRVRLEAPTEGILVFRESFSPYWVAGDLKPMVVDFYANGYFVPAGSYEFIVQHMPEALYQGTLLLATLVPLVLLTATGMVWLVEFRCFRPSGTQ